MTKYYVNEISQPNGDYEVHTKNCDNLPEVRNRKYLGEFSNCQKAVKEAKKHFEQVNGCYYCSKECHTT